MQALVDGGFKNRKYGSSLSDLDLKEIADRLVGEELISDDDAKFASVVSSEKTGGLGGTSYYVIRYQVNNKPAIAKLAVLQQRLYCIRHERRSRLKLTFDKESALREDLEAITESYFASASTRRASRCRMRGACRERACARCYVRDDKHCSTTYKREIKHNMHTFRVRSYSRLSRSLKLPISWAAASFAFAAAGPARPGGNAGAAETGTCCCCSLPAAPRSSPTRPRRHEHRQARRRR